MCFRTRETGAPLSSKCPVRIACASEHDGLQIDKNCPKQGLQIDRIDPILGLQIDKITLFLGLQIDKAQVILVIIKSGS